MTQQKLTLISGLMNTIKPTVKKLFPLLALSALAATAAHAERVEIANDCPAAKIIHEKYVKFGGFLEKAEGSPWTLVKGYMATPNQYDLNRLELTSVEAVINPETYTPASFACHYNNPGNSAAPLALKFDVGRAKVTFQQGYAVVTGSAPNMFNDERDGTDYWVTPKDKPLSRICDKNNKRENGFATRCGGFSINEDTQPNGFWKNVNDGCRDSWTLCGNRPLSYQILFQKLDNADTDFKYCAQWGGPFNLVCQREETVKRKPYCDDIKCTYEITLMNRLVEGYGTKDTKANQGWARYQNMCWAGKKWEYKLWDDKGGDNCDADKIKPASWPDYSELNIPE